jgi:chromosome partitioning protein
MANLNILVMNNKGGSGKTTVATNLAAAYACRNVRVALMDCDAQANARHWGQSRSDDDLPIDIQFHPDPRTIDAAATASHDVCIYDSAPAITHGPSLHLEFETLLKLSDVILVPMLGSSWDIQSGEHFITQLMTQRVWRAKPRPYRRDKQPSRRQLGKPSTFAELSKLAKRTRRHDFTGIAGIPRSRR